MMENGVVGSAMACDLSFWYMEILFRRPARECSSWWRDLLFGMIGAWNLISSTLFCSVSYEKQGCLCTGHAIENRRHILWMNGERVKSCCWVAKTASMIAIIYWPSCWRLIGVDKDSERSMTLYVSMLSTMKDLKSGTNEGWEMLG
jgi:hypothetical protein